MGAFYNLMAQHIPIEDLRREIFQRIASQIRKDFNGYGAKSRLKYSFNEGVSSFYQKHLQDEVYFCERGIGRNSRGLFEIHFNKESRQVEQIYFVA